MKIRMQALAAGPSGTWQPGQIVEVPEAVGLRLVAGGYAVDVSPKEPNPSPSLKGREEEGVDEPEDARAPGAPERAVIVRRGKRK